MNTINVVSYHIMSNTQIRSLITTLTNILKSENANGTENEIEYIVISGRKEYNHAYKIKTKSGELFVRKIYFVTTELEANIKNAMIYEQEYLCSIFSEYIDPQIVPNYLKQVAVNYIKTFDDDNCDKQIRKSLYDEIFKHVLENPLEKFSYCWWNYYITHVVQNMHNTYFISNFTEL